MYWILVPKSEKNNHIWPGASEDDVDDDTSKYSTKLIKIDASYTVYTRV